MHIFIILPTQIFKHINILKKYDKIYLIEEPYYINPNFHKQKLLLHISSLNYYYELLKSKYNNVNYIKYNEIDYSKILKNVNTITMYDPIDNKMILKYKKYNVIFLDSPLFLNNYSDLLNYKNNVKTKNNIFQQSNFYKYQRIKYKILLNNNNEPLYNKWSFDNLNREKFTKDYKELNIKEYNNKYINYGKKYINSNFKNAFGSMDIFCYPCTHKDALNHFNKFIKQKIKYFGKYQDAISKNVIYGYHSNISALLNIGLLNPLDIINIILKHFNNSNNKKEIINSIEGIIRQIIGWREYMHFIYLFYSNKLKRVNYLSLNTTLPKSWYIGNTDLNILNHLIIKLHNYAYLHHIERLMIINNLMYLYEIKIKDIYKWFMTCFIDSYDWVMVPNIIMNINSLNPDIKYMTKVYIASDNYIKKMSDFTDKNDFKIINVLYWKFIKKK